MTENKTKPTSEDVSRFLDAVPDEARRADAKAVGAMARVHSATAKRIACVMAVLSESGEPIAGGRMLGLARRPSRAPPARCAREPINVRVRGR